jgi:hypothetical protein
MITAVTMLGEAFRQWQKDWDSYDKGIGDKPKSYDEFISPFIEVEKKQHETTFHRGINIGAFNPDMDIEGRKEASKHYYDSTFIKLGRDRIQDISIG